MKESLWQHITAVRNQSPLVHNITNYVVMNNTANALLAIGASPIMAHAQPEIKQMLTICQSLVINIGTLDEYWVNSMLLAATTANELKKPWIFDPVGAGATSYRDEVSAQILDLKPSVIRGNASEIIALAKYNKTATKGVESTAKSSEAVEAAVFLNQSYGSVVCISGETDIIVDDHQQIHLSNGDVLMTKITGMGCSATAIIAAFAAVVKNTTEAVVAAMALLGVAGEMSVKTATGPGSLQVQLLDQLYLMTESEFYRYLRISDVQ